MSADITKSVCSSAELVRKMWSLQAYRFVQWFVSGGCPIYVLVAKKVLKMDQNMW
jgi:hypothetical protein